MYQAEGNVEKYLYKFTALPVGFVYDGNYGYLESRKEFIYGNLTRFYEGQKFMLNGKLVEVAKSSQLYICFYSSQRLSESEAVLIKCLLGKYGKSFSVYDSDSMKYLNVDPAKRTNFYFFDTRDTDFRHMSKGNYISIIGSTITDFIHDTFKNTYDVESIVLDGKAVEDYFEFIEDSN